MNNTFSRLTMLILRTFKLSKFNLCLWGHYNLQARTVHFQNKNRARLDSISNSQLIHLQVLTLYIYWLLTVKTNLLSTYESKLRHQHLRKSGGKHSSKGRTYSKRDILWHDDNLLQVHWNSQAQLVQYYRPIVHHEIKHFQSIITILQGTEIA